MRFVLIGLALLLSLNPAYALNTIYLPAELQSPNANPVPRTLYLKLPLQQADSDWVFTNTDDVLAGGLELRIIRNNQVVEDIIIFSQGVFAKGWYPILPPVPTAPHAMYFGFMSTIPYKTAPGDKLVLRFEVAKPLKGIGPNSSGLLPRGLYVSSGGYSGLVDTFDITKTEQYKNIVQSRLSVEDKQAIIQELHGLYNKKAFMNAWTEQWSLSITTNSGWLDEYNQPEEKT